jgi:hypothetical protein
MEAKVKGQAAPGPGGQSRPTFHGFCGINLESLAIVMDIA